MMINKYNELTQYVPKRYWGNDDVQKLIYEKLKNIAKTYECGDIEVIQNYSSYSIIIKFVSILGIPKRLSDLKKAIEKVVPCHLGISYDFKYNTLNDLTPYTLQEFVSKGLTLDDLASGDLKTLLGH